MRIRIEFQGPGFVAVPNHVVALVGNGLEAVDLAALVVLAALPVGSDWSATWVQKRLGLGRDAWQAISRRLRAVGAVWDDVQTGEDGRHRGRLLSVRWPDAAPGAEAKRRRSKGGGASGWKHRKPGKPNAGKSGMGMPEKPNAGKAGIRSAQVIEIEGETPVEVCETGGCPKTKTDGCADAPLRGATAAQPSVSDMQAEGERVGRVVSGLTAFQRDRVERGEAVLIDGRLVKGGTREAAAIVAALDRMRRELQPGQGCLEPGRL